MRCKVCDYRLWNLKARQCPECGTPFSVNDYEFIPNSVQFCCPHCSQDYYGTGHKGHLVPEAFLCVKCGQSVHMNDMVLLPTEGIEEERTAPQYMPWLERQHNGWWRSWWSTVRMSLTTPDRLVRSLPAETPVSQAWRFAAATLGLALAGAIAVLFIFAVMMSGGMGGGRAFGLAPFAIPVWIGIMLAGIVVWAALAHLFLLLTGGTRYGFGRTCEALCYSVGANVLLVIPICGMCMYWIWWLVSAAIMLKERQRVHALRATLALMTLPVLIAAGIGLTIWRFSRGPTFTATWPPTATAPAPTPGSAEMRTISLAARLIQYAMNNGGRGPQHFAETLDPGYPPQDLLLPDTATVPTAIGIGDLTLNSFGSLSLPEQDRAAAIEAAIAALPPDAIAYRLGDFVFTYPGMDFQRLNQKLWTVIAWPDPDANPTGTPTEVIVGLLDGGTTRLYGPQMEMFLADQNALRVKNGLPPLPHPSSVRHGQPARVQAEQEP